MTIIHADKKWFRFFVLFFNCLVTFGSYYCFDIPSVLQSEFQGNSSCTPDNSSTGGSNSSCCPQCLGMSPENYNLLYAIYAWTNAFVVVGSGFFIDKLGNRVGMLVFSSFCVVGSSAFAAGAFLKNTPYILPVMLIGRLLFGCGNGSLTIVQNRVTAYWFKDKELAMAFGVTLAFSRLGSVLNFLVTPSIAETYGLLWTLWGGALLCGFGLLAGIIVGFLDKLGVKQLGQEDNLAAGSKQLRVTDIKRLSVRFWLLILVIMFFYNGVFPFVADASKFIQDKYDMGDHPQTAAIIAGAVYDVSMVLSPILGYAIDIFGKRGIIALMCGVLTMPVFGMLAFSMVPPLVCTLWLGVTYSFAAPSMWPSVPLVVPHATVGTAFGITTCVQMIGIGLSNVIVGQILGSKDLPPAESVGRWRYVMIFLFANAIMCVITAAILIVVDKRQDGVLNESKVQRQAREHLMSQRPRPDSFADTQPVHGKDMEEDDNQPSETDPLLPRRRTGIN